MIYIVTVRYYDYSLISPKTVTKRMGGGEEYVLRARGLRELDIHLS